VTARGRVFRPSLGKFKVRGISRGEKGQKSRDSSETANSRGTLRWGYHRSRNDLDESNAPRNPVVSLRPCARVRLGLFLRDVHRKA